MVKAESELGPKATRETKHISLAEVPPLPTSPCLALSLASWPMTGKNPQGRISLRQALVTRDKLAGKDSEGLWQKGVMEPRPSALK